MEGREERKQGILTIVQSGDRGLQVSQRSPTTCGSPALLYKAFKSRLFFGNTEEGSVRELA